MFGLVNTGSICYLNSTLQALLSLGDFRNCISKHRSANYLLGTLAEFVDAYGGGGLHSVGKLKYQLSQFSDFFRQHGQQDSHECLVALLDTIHEILRVPKSDTNPAFNEYLRVFGFSFVTDLFAGQTKSQLVCGSCRKSRNSFGTMMDLSIPVIGRTLYDSLRAFGSHELLGDPIQCDNCRASTKTFRTMSISRFPKILIITLVNPDRVSLEIPEILEISNKTYILVSVVNHMGTLLTGGHYFCTVRYNNKWFNVDDNTVRPLKKMEWPPGSPYILLYEKTNLIA